MIKKFLISISFTFTILMSGCASVELGRRFDSGSVSVIAIGVTSKTQIYEMLGDPYAELDPQSFFENKVFFGNKDTTLIWRYLYGKGHGSIISQEAQVKFLQIDFNNKGIVTDYYYSSSFYEDATPDCTNNDFDIFAANDMAKVGETRKEKILDTFGNGYIVIKINKPNVQERWRYGYTREEGGKTHGKSMDFDFDTKGVLMDFQIESDFTKDVDYFKTKYRK